MRTHPKLAILMILAGMAGLYSGRVWSLDKVEVKAHLDKEKVSLGEEVQFLITVHYGRHVMPPEIEIPSFFQFAILDHRVQKREKQDEAEVYNIHKEIWRLEPLEAGKLSIAPVIITYQDSTSGLLDNTKTDAVFLEVLPRKNEANPNAQSASKTAVAKRLLLNWAWPAAIFGGMALMGFLAWLRLGRTQPGRKNENTITPEKIALEDLQQAVVFAEEEQGEKYFEHLTQALLEYIQNKFGIPAHALPSADLLNRLKAFAIPAEYYPKLENFFRVMDKTKFAGYTPKEEEIIGLHSAVAAFIEAGSRVHVKLSQAKPMPRPGNEA